MKDFLQENWAILCTLVIALYGAVLSTINARRERKGKQRKVEVKISNGFLTSGPEISDLMLLIEVSNPGNREVTINIPDLRLPDKRRMVLIPGETGVGSNVRFPYTLSEGTACQVWAKMDIINQTIRDAGFSGKIKIWSYVKDQVGNEYRSNPWKMKL